LETIVREKMPTQAGFNLPNSWYIALVAKKLGKKPIGLKLFGQELIAWRNRQGQPVIMNRYCPHMGASLLEGKIKGDCIECPFHHWQWHTDGACQHIPSQAPIPQTARILTYPAQEKYGYIWVWYGSAEPYFGLPAFAPAEAEKSRYMPVRFSFKVKTTVRRLLENNYDEQHLLQVHKLKASQISLITTPSPFGKHLPGIGALIEAKIQGFVGPAGWIAKKLGLDAENLKISVKSFPSGHLIDLCLNDEVKFTTLFGVTPVEAKETIQQVLLAVPKTSSRLRNFAYYLMFGVQTVYSAYQDLPIWNKLDPDGGGVYIKHDKGVLEYRKFYQSGVNE
jgi:aminopyrrolnitrin oxygenase